MSNSGYAPIVIAWLEGRIKAMKQRLPALEKAANLENFNPTEKEEAASEQHWLRLREGSRLEQTISKFEYVVDYLKKGE